MAFEIQPATIDDVPEIVRVFHESFAQDTSFLACYGAVPFSMLEQFFVYQFTDIFTHRWVHHFKIIDTSSGEIAGYSHWQACRKVTMAKEKDNPLPWHLVDGLNIPLCGELFLRSQKLKDVWYDEERDFYMEVLAVRPQYRRLGLGSLLVQVGLDAADAVGAKVYTEATPLGRPLYNRFNFEPVAESTVDLGDRGTITEVCMVRNPHSSHNMLSLLFDS